MPSSKSLDNINTSLDLYGHDDVLMNFIKLYENGNFPKVSLITGEKGIGKFTFINHYMYFYFDNKNLSKIYSKCFSISTDLIFAALENLKKGKFISPTEDYSYFSFPNKDRWKKFRDYGGQFF